MSFAEDLATVKEQERLLVFESFSADTAWALGGHLRDAALALQAAMTFEIQVAGRTLLLTATDGAPQGHADWIRRKRNVVMRFSRSTYALGLELGHAGRTMEDRHGLTLADYAMHGGGLPIVLRGTGCVGSVIASGLDQRDDHEMVVEAMAKTLGVQVPKLVPHS